jgi:ferric-dicitrate binding protein FerR (iron transport regulator)
MTAPLYARLAGKLLARELRSASPPPSPAERAAATGAIERALEGRARARRRRRWLTGVAAAAAAAALVGGAVRWTTHRAQPLATGAAREPSTPVKDVQVVGYSVAGSARVVSAGTPAPLDDRRALPAGSRIVTPAGSRAVLAFTSGTQVLLGEGGDMTIADERDTQALRLDHGSLELHVAKLAERQRFLVQTADAEVEVRGTAFRVSLVPADSRCGSGTPTRVAVNEGVVVVRQGGQESRIEAGQQWPAGCTPAVGAARPAPAVASHGVAASVPASSLGEQNDLFGEAMSARRRGEAGKAIEAFSRFLARYPASALAESATVERMRLLRQADPDRAVVEARQYLARYPRGFASAEAEEIVAGTP